MKILVIYYSLEGNTKLIAESIAKNIGADTLELVPKKQYATSGFKKFFWGGKSVVFKEKPELMPVDKDINEYDTIFIGTPIWVGTYAPPFNTFLDEYNFTNKNLALFACHGGGGAQKFYKNIQEKLCNNNFLGTIDFVDPLNSPNENISKAQKWSSEIINKII